MADHSREYIECKFSPHWNYISAARAFIQNFLMTSTGDQARADKAAMAASELLENAIKYSPDSETLLVIGVGDRIVIAVTNQSDRAGCERLRATYEEAIAKPPIEAYMDRMKSAASRDDGSSGLGLVRIRYEAEAELELDITDTFAVTMKARL